MERRVVITGLGVVSGLGVGMPALWDGLKGGRSALKRITRFDPAGFPSRLAAEAVDFPSAKDFVPKSYRKAVKVMARDTELAVAAAKLAVEDAGLKTRGTLPEDGSGGAPTYPSPRMGCHIGAGLIAAETDELTSALATASMPAAAEVGGLPGALALDLKAWGTAEGGSGGMNNLQPLWLLKYLPNMLACHVTIIHGAEGPSNTITCAEASGLLSIGESVRVIERGDADLCFSGGAESKINLMGLLRLDLAGRLAHTGEEADGSRTVRPYDPASKGGLLGEGGGILVLEELESAARRGARPYAEIVGFGSAHSVPPLRHPLPRPEDAPEVDEGTRDAIEAALADAGVTAAEIDAIVPQACGAPSVDKGEAGALRAVFGRRLGEVPIVTVAPNIGGTCAALGAIGVAVGAMCVREQMLPARLHAGSPQDGLDAGAAPARPARLRNVLVVTGSIGGQNAAAVLRAIA